MNFYIPSPGNLLEVNTPFTIFDKNRFLTGPYHTLQQKERLIILAIIQDNYARNYLLLSADNKRIYNIQILSQSSYNEFIDCTSKLS